MTEKDEKSINSNEKISSSVFKVEDKILCSSKLDDDIYTALSSLSSLQASLNNMSKNLNSELVTGFLSVSTNPLKGLKASLNIPSQIAKPQNLRLYSPHPNVSSSQKTDKKIDLEDILKISRKHKKIFLFDFFDLNQQEAINDFSRSISGKDLVHINDNKSKEVMQLSINHILLNTDLPKNVSSICVHFGYFFGYHFSLIFECDLNVEDLYEKFSKNDTDSLIECFQLFEDLQVQIEESLPEQFHGFFYKNELRFEKPNLKLLSIYVYDIHDYKFIFDIEYNEKSMAPIDRPTLKQKVEFFVNFSLNQEDKYSEKVEFNALSLLRIEPKKLFTLIGDKLICSKSNNYFEDFLGQLPSNFVILEFKDDELLNFIFQLVPLYYLLTIFEKVLIDLSKVKIPEIKISELPHLDEEILKVKKAEVLKTKIILDEIVRDLFLYLRAFDYFSSNDFRFSNEVSRDRISFKGQKWDNDSISKFLSDLIIYKKKEIVNKQTHLEKRISEIDELIQNELSIIKNKPKVNSLLNEIETELILRIKRWEGLIPQDKIENWLLNFDTKEERLIALKLLDKLTYVSNKNLKQLIDSSNNLLHSKINLDTSQNCFFSCVGDITSGSTHLAKHFQEESRIKEKLFKKTEEIELLIEKNGKIDKLILIDDFIGSGNTYIKWYKKNIQLIKNCSEVILIVLIALKKGINKIEQKTNTKVLCKYILDESNQVIDGTLFDCEERQEINRLVNKYSYLINSDFVYGYDNCQLLLAFEDNIPNNSIGILWWSTNWTPLFERK